MISFIVPTLGRATILRTLMSIYLEPDDEILVIGNVSQAEVGQTRYIPCAPGGDGGNKERNVAMALARGTHLAFIDDDDAFLPATRRVMGEVMRANPDAPAIFRMRFPNGITIWIDHQIRVGNFGTPCLFVPNRPEMLGVWREGHHCGDFWFALSWKWPAESVIWRPEIVAQVGHNPGEAPTDKAKLAARRAEGAIAR